MGPLAKPNRDLVSRVLNDVGYEGRLVGQRMHKRMGPLTITMYRFSEVVAFLRDEYTLLDLNELENWLKTIMRDNELADTVSDIIRTEPRHKERTQKIGTVLAERLNQCEVNCKI